MSAKKDPKPKGTILTDLDVVVTSADDEPIWRMRSTILGAALYKKDQKTGECIKDASGEMVQDTTQEILTRRMAILLALATETEKQNLDADAKLRAGHMQRVFYKDSEVKVDSEEVEFIKDRLLHRWGGVVYTDLCEYLEGVSK